MSEQTHELMNITSTKTEKQEAEWWRIEGTSNRRFQELSNRINS